LTEELGCSWFDVDSVQRYGSVDNLAETYGFIFGRRAIQHVLRTEQTSIRWRFRVHHRAPEAAPAAETEHLGML
jgi:hypothetical protein